MNPLESIDHILSTARSVRRKLDFERPIPDQVLLDCIDIATQAPSGLSESWRFVIVRDPDRKARIAALYRAALEELVSARGLDVKPTQNALTDRLHEMPALVFVCAQDVPDLAEIPQQVAFYGSVLPAAWSLMLALRAREIGTTWTSLLMARRSEVSGLLDLPDGALPLVMLPVAYTLGARLRRAERLPSREVTYFDRWGMKRTEEE
ncbi:MAG: nitroreductase family protein [Gammaproteobacteria bacterium]|nr:nitroreductase family protein [Gammaproteobacteria bacterium]